jgi:hypothetical protein
MVLLTLASEPRLMMEGAFCCYIFYSLDRSKVGASLLNIELVSAFFKCSYHRLREIHPCFKRSYHFDLNLSIIVHPLHHLETCDIIPTTMSRAK